MFSYISGGLLGQGDVSLIIEVSKENLSKLFVAYKPFIREKY